MTNLPAPRTSFVGRQRELDELAALLVAARLITLTGPAGTGKTRLAVEAARLRADAFPDGVCLADLAPLSDPELVPSTVAQVLGVTEAAGLPLRESVVRFLRDKRLLLVLDNCEHLLLVAEWVGSLLAACPQLTVLATSREPLRVPGEHHLPVLPLALPAAHETTVEALALSPAVTLFCERAAAVRPAFALSLTNASDVAAVCRRLDGLPLAIELAAARLKLLSVSQIAARLEERFRLLTGGPEAPWRHQTLQAAVGWSYDLLTPAEQALFARLAVFAGGFTLEAVEAVVAPEAIAGAYPLDVLERLVDQSLVVVEQTGETTRFRLLETLRAFAAERLAASGLTESNATRHAEFYLTLAESAAPHLSGPEQVRWLAELEAERDNLRAALGFFAASTAGAETGLRLAAALWRFWELRGPQREGRDWLDRLLHAAPGAVPLLRIRALRGAAWLATRQSDHGAARRLLDQALELCRTSNDPAVTADVLSVLAGVARLQLDYTTAGCATEEALALLRDGGPPVTLASLLNEAGNVALMHDDAPTAQRYLQEGLLICRAHGLTLGLAVTMDNLARATWELAEPDDAGPALALAHEALATHRQLGNRVGMASVLSTLAQIAVDRGELDTAQHYRIEAIALYREVNNRHGSALCLTHLGHIARGRGDLHIAEARFREALTEAVAMDDRLTLAWCLWGPALLAGDRGEHEQAATLLSALDASRATLHYSLWKQARRDQERCLAAARAAMGKAAVERCQAVGATLSLQDVLVAAFGGPLPVPDTVAPATPTTRQRPRRTEHGIERLSRREREVFRLLANGLSNKEIASGLTLSVRTVERHVAGIYARLGVRSRSEATATALRADPALLERPLPAATDASRPAHRRTRPPELG